MRTWVARDVLLMFSSQVRRLLLSVAFALIAWHSCTSFRLSRAGCKEGRAVRCDVPNVVTWILVYNASMQHFFGVRLTYIWRTQACNTSCSWYWHEKILHWPPSLESAEEIYENKLISELLHIWCPSHQKLKWNRLKRKDRKGKEKPWIYSAVKLLRDHQRYVHRNWWQCAETKPHHR